MTQLSDVNNEIAGLDEKFWELVRRGDYATAEAQGLAERIRDLKAQRRELLAVDAVGAPDPSDDNPQDR